MSKYLQYTLSIFVMAVTLSAITSTSVNAEVFCFCVGGRSVVLPFCQARFKLDS